MFLRIPALITIITENQETDTVDGITIVNIDEIQNIVGNDDNKCTIFFTSGDSIGCLISLDDMMNILPECK